MNNASLSNKSLKRGQSYMSVYAVFVSVCLRICICVYMYIYTKVYLCKRNIHMYVYMYVYILHVYRLELVLVLARPRSKRVPYTDSTVLPRWSGGSRLIIMHTRTLRVPLNRGIWSLTVGIWGIWRVDEGSTYTCMSPA